MTVPLHQRGPERTDNCSECGEPFTTRHATKVTCGEVCSYDRERRLKRERTAEITAEREAARREAQAADPEWMADHERHQSQLRRVWEEHGLPLSDLEAQPFYWGGFTAEQAVEIVNHDLSAR